MIAEDLMSIKILNVGFPCIIYRLETGLAKVVFVFLSLLVRVHSIMLLSNVYLID